MSRRSLIAAVVAALALVAAAPAYAHVSVNPGEAPKGSFAKLTFRVPNERDAASTTKVELAFPSDHPIENVSVKPVTGWTYVIGRTGVTVSRITWTGGPIKPGEFYEFDVSVGPLPEDADQLVFQALQTYDNGEDVRWIEETPEGGEEPEHPAPVLKLTAATGDEHGGGEEEPAAEESAAEDEGEEEEDEDESATTIAWVALALGAIGLIAAIGALARTRPRQQP
jgi:uncharacterized protein YcnI